MKRTLLLLFVLFTVLELISCSKDIKRSANNMPDMGVQEKNWNTSIRLVDDPVLSNSYKNGDVLMLRVENISETQIIFPNDFGIKLITWNGQNWANINNNFYYTFQPVLPTKKSFPLGLILNALPYIPDLSSALKIRIVIVGHSENNDKELLGAYLDVMINP